MFNNLDNDELCANLHSLMKDALKKSASPQNEKLKAQMRKSCAITADYEILFTKSQNDANILAIYSIIDGFIRQTKKIPHIVANYMESPGILNLLDKRAKDGTITVSYVRPNIYGAIVAESIEKAIRPNTALVVASFVNFQLGTVNNLKIIGAAAHKHKVPIHSDCTFIFGKYALALTANNIDVAVCDFGKIHGPQDLGVIVISKKLIQGYKLFMLDPEIMTTCAVQENVGIQALAESYKSRPAKMANLNKLRGHFINKLTKIADKFYYYDDIIKNKTPTKLGDVIVLSVKPALYKHAVPYIISFIWITGKSGKQIQAALAKKNIAVYTPAVVMPSNRTFNEILLLDKWITKIICCSLSDYNTTADIDKLFRELILLK